MHRTMYIIFLHIVCICGHNMISILLGNTMYRYCVSLSDEDLLYYSIKSSAVAEIGDCGHKRHGPKSLLCPFRGEVGPRLIQCGLGRGLLQYRTNWRLHPSSHLATIDMGQKIVWAWGWVCPFSGGSCRVPIEQSCLGQDLPPYPVAS